MFQMNSFTNKDLQWQPSWIFDRHKNTFGKSGIIQGRDYLEVSDKNHFKIFPKYFFLILDLDFKIKLYTGMYDELMNSYKSITNRAWVRARLCKLQKGCTRLAASK